MLWITDCESFKNYPEKVYDGIHFGKVTNLQVQCAGCNSYINRRYHRLFLEYIPKNSCLNKNIYAEKVYGVPCTCAQPTILLKMELTWELSQEASKNMMYLREPPWRKLHFSKNGGLKSIPAILWKTKSTTKWFMYLLCEVGLLEKFRKIFLWD